MSKYLRMGFRDARLFRKHNKENINRKCKDFSLDVLTGTYKSRDFLPSFVEPITVHQVSNMLHVLFNERPVPSFRKCLYPRVEHYFDMANNSYIKIDTPKKNNGDFYYETMHVKKGVHNAWNTSPQVDWEIARRYMDDNEKFIKIINKLNEILGIDVQTIPLREVRELVNNLPVVTKTELYEIIINLKDITGLVDYFEGRQSAITCKWNKTARMVNSGIETVVNLSGQIIVPVSEEDILRLRTISKGCATILDGGLVWIDSLKDGSDISIEGFIKVKDISDKKTKPALCES